MGLESLTESAQPRATRPAKKRAAPTYARPSSQKQTVVFDEDARREFLTGFSKRKTQRRQAAHAHVQRLIRDEIRQARLAAAEARKRQAAENVRAEQLAYGAADDSAPQDDDDDDDKQEEIERDFESDEHRAHVTVQTLELDEDAPRPAPRAAPAPPPPSPPPRKTTAPPTAAAPSGSLTGILEPDVAHAAMSDHVFPTVAARTERERPTTYTSKAERMQERQRQRARHHAQAEKRRAQQRAQHAAKKTKTTKPRRS